MRLDHLPDGSFKRLLSGRRKQFPALARHELIEIFGVEFKPEIVNLRQDPNYKILCDQADFISHFLCIPPLNLYWIQNLPFVKAYLTPESNSIILTGPINAVIASEWKHILRSLVVHEMGHGLQGDLDQKTTRDGELGQKFRHRKEFEADAFAAVFTSPDAALDMIDVCAGQKYAAGNKRAFFHDDIDPQHPSLYDRFGTIFRMRTHEVWKDYIWNHGHIHWGLLREEDSGNRWASKIARQRDLEVVMGVINATPFSRN